jgi:hypothetical protein
VEQQKAQNRFYHSSALAITAILVLDVLITGCTRLAAEQGISQTVVPTTATAPGMATPTLTHLDASATKIAFDQAERDAVATLIASGTPFVSTPLPLPTQAPVLTPLLGINGDCAQGDSKFDHQGCWTGRTNTEYIFVSLGAFWNDLTQGILRVYTSTLDLRTYGQQQLYQTPLKTGPIHVVAVDGDQLTLQAENSTLFYFDLATRQWVTPDPTPGPTPIPSSLPPTP